MNIYVKIKEHITLNTKNMATEIMTGLKTDSD